MAKQILPTNYKDDVLTTSMGKKRRYNLIQNDDGTISLEDATEYTQVGDNYGAAQLNATNQAVNESVDQAKVIDSLDDISANTQPGMVAGALAVAELSGKSGKLIENKIDYQEYTLLGGKVKVISGSVIRTGVGKNYIALFSAEQLKDYFGVTVNTTRLSISTCNGDDASQAVQFYAPENWQGSIYQYFSAVVSGSIRINYRMVYVYE